jgi:eukaryotic-like serine/threonine-protein kinase
MTEETVTTPEEGSGKRPGQGLKPYQKLGKYRLQKRLGKGGYCEVWKARDTVEGIWVALKLPQTDVAGKRDNESVLREVRLVAGLRHPCLMPVKNADIIDNHAFLATELSTGTLGDCSRPMGVRRVFTIMRQVLEGLAFAHLRHVVHCDVTPDNIFLFPNGRARLGDFGIGVHFTGRMKTIDDYGTPGYVSPEQAYGKPTYRSDCFSVALVLYEFLTGVLPRWPFKWPPKGLERLRERTGIDFVRFMKKAMDAEPEKRFANAQQMLTAFDEALPSGIKRRLLISADATPDWQQLRKKTFVQKYRRVIADFYPCVECGESIAEAMHCCPWCGSERNRFDDRTRFSHLCHRCHRGVAPQWRYCPWCYGAGFEPQQGSGTVRMEYNDRCEHCRGKMTYFMKYCPWCNRKHGRWQIRPFPEVCNGCGWSVDSSYWVYCPWCEQKLI